MNSYLAKRYPMRHWVFWAALWWRGCTGPPTTEAPSTSRQHHLLPWHPDGSQVSLTAARESLSKPSADHTTASLSLTPFKGWGLKSKPSRRPSRPQQIWALPWVCQALPTLGPYQLMLSHLESLLWSLCTHLQVSQPRGWVSQAASGSLCPSPLFLPRSP